MTEGLTQAEVQVIINSEIQKVVHVINNMMSEGCFKGKEHDNYIKGELSSKLNDMKAFREKQDIKNLFLESKIREAIKMVQDSLGYIHEANKTLENYKDNLENFEKTTDEKQEAKNAEMKKEIKSMRRMGWGLILVLAGAVFNLFFK